MPIGPAQVGMTLDNLKAALGPEDYVTTNKVSRGVLLAHCRLGKPYWTVKEVLGYRRMSIGIPEKDLDGSVAGTVRTIRVGLDNPTELEKPLRLRTPSRVRRVPNPPEGRPPLGGDLEGRGRFASPGVCYTCRGGYGPEDV